MKVFRIQFLQEKGTYYSEGMKTIRDCHFQPHPELAQSSQDRMKTNSSLFLLTLWCCVEPASDGTPEKIQPMISLSVHMRDK